MSTQIQAFASGLTMLGLLLERLSELFRTCSFNKIHYPGQNALKEMMEKFPLVLKIKSPKFYTMTFFKNIIYPTIVACKIIHDVMN